MSFIIHTFVVSKGEAENQRVGKIKNGKLWKTQNAHQQEK